MTTRALDLITAQPWAVEPAALDTILQIAQRANDTPEAVAAKLGRPLENTRQVRQRDATAIIPVTGPIFRRGNLLTEISGATSVEVLATDLQTAADNPAIERIVLEIDSPGGQATGIAELAAQIRAIGQTKPVVAYVDGMAASAAYWLAAAATEIIADKTALLGSIGVIASYRPEKDAPIKIISSVSPLKQATPDTDSGRAELQRIVDDLAAIFVNDIAAYRGVSPEHVAQHFGRGGVLIAARAVDAGMANRLAGFETLFQSAGTAGYHPQRGPHMTYQADVNAALGLPAEASAEQATAAIQASSAKLTTATEDGKAAGAAAERERTALILEALTEHPHATETAHAAIAAGLSFDQAQAMIKAVPAPTPSANDANGTNGPSAFEQHMAAIGNPPISPDQDTRSDPDAEATALWDRIATRYAPAKH
ncbi:MAG: S49 family peptidase [Lamprobacter sp.]|uniref:S49 family peptidase n=1 Tax=Lamprobacter sp. TaxID=3100796 RepID=UPI002B25735A|nr:S49 family peptidase [Lamprobacter sp.]MEA3641290.1 S49 family peptidase [Lamprobacter sp.]